MPALAPLQSALSTFSDVRIDGAFRLSTGFAAGAALPRAAGVTVAFRNWSSAADSTEFAVTVTEHDIGQGNELAVAIAVTDPLTDDVLDYLHATSLPVEKLVVIEPSNGTGQTSIPGEGEALGFSYAAFAEIRKVARQHTKLHVFANCPNGVAILLGHLWNRVPTTQLYDDANGPAGYFPTFLLPS
jgi:hypothetical protein